MRPMSSGPVTLLACDESGGEQISSGIFIVICGDSSPSDADGSGKSAWPRLRVQSAGGMRLSTREGHGDRATAMPPPYGLRKMKSEDFPPEHEPMILICAHPDEMS